MSIIKNIFRGGAVALSAVLLSSCAAITFVKPDGTTDEPVWPQWDKVRFDNGQGIFPNRDNLNQVTAGMSKDQLYYLLGRPHYDDAWRPVEWNYLFYFRTPGKGTNDVSTCQYKVLFDKDMIARNFYWNPIDPADGVCPPAP
ncbi:MAG: outer membrane protein assembly factor BamE [Neisseria sp.]|nr:outer membrane protein assembly factor BamE [Neisseria sp.]